MSSLIYLASVDSALNNLYTNYLKTWAPVIALIGISLGAIVWMIGGSVGNSAAGAIGIRVVAICIIAVAVAMGASDLVNIGKALGV